MTLERGRDRVGRMIPLSRQVFWGLMAVCIMGGLATLLACLFLPALYAAWYRVREEAKV